MSPSIKCDYLVSRPFRRGVWRSCRGRININSATKRWDWQPHNSKAYKVLGAPKQLTFQLISLNPLQNKLRLSHWKERHRLMGDRMKREELSDMRALIPCEVTDMNYENPLGYLEWNPEVLTLCTRKQGPPSINRSLIYFSALHICQHYSSFLFIYTYRSAESAYVKLVGYNFRISHRHHV
jgi:hypothetical protein